MKTVVRVFVLLATALSASSCGVAKGPSLIDGASDQSSIAGPSPIPLITFVTGQAAAVVLGQSVFTSNGSGQSATNMDFPLGNASSFGGALYVNEYSNNRVLGFNSIPSINGAAADFVIGQANFTSGNPGTDQQSVAYQYSTSTSAAAGLAIADNGNNRILFFDPAPTSTLPSATRVLGQTGFGTSTYACTASALRSPSSVSIGGGKVVVADGGNNRVLVWNSVPTSNGAPADVVLGQPDMTSCGYNRGGSTSADSLAVPASVWTDGRMLIVSDPDNQRLLLWRSMPTTNGQPADLVLGQPDFTSDQPNANGPTSALGMNAGSSKFSSVFSTGRQIFHTDTANNRVQIWNSIPAVNGAPADVVLGQIDFASGGAASPPTNASLRAPDGVVLVGTKLVVTDSSNNRVLVFQGQ